MITDSVIETIPRKPGFEIARSIWCRPGPTIRDVPQPLRPPSGLRQCDRAHRLRLPRSFRSVRPVSEGHPLATLDIDREHVRSLEPQAGLLSVNRVSHRPFTRQQCRQSIARSRHSRSSAASQHQLGRAGGRGAGCRAGQWGAGPPGGLFPGFDGHHAAPGDGLRPEVRIRNFQAVLEKRMAAGATR